MVGVHARGTGAIQVLLPSSPSTKKHPTPQTNLPLLAQEIERRCAASTCASLREKALLPPFTACFQANVREWRGAARLF
jgi:hypothetical protein